MSAVLPPVTPPTTRTYPVSEIFGPTIQGEGHLIGLPTVFVRFGGCDYRCSWCDSLHAVLPEYRANWTPLTVEEIAARVRALAGPCLVTLSGGNPALHPLGPLLDTLHRAGYTVAVETQGTKWPAWLDFVDELVLSPKPPSSGETVSLTRFRKRLGEYAAAVPIGAPSVKVVIFEEADLDFYGEVRAIVRAIYPRGARLAVSVGTPPERAPIAGRDVVQGYRLLDRTAWLVAQVLARGWTDTRVLPQLHVLLWGNDRGR